MIAGTGAFTDSESVPNALLQAIEGRFPVLGIGWGMHALNVALGGQPPAMVEGHGQPDLPGGEESVKHPVFIAPGGKVSYTIAGSGWVTVPSAHTHGLMPGQVADGLLSSVYAEDRVVEAIEKPGHGWLSSGPPTSPEAPQRASIVCCLPLSSVASNNCPILGALAQARTRCAYARESVMLKYHPCSFRTHAR